MGSIVIDVMLKSEILDPQGQAVRGALPRLGFSDFTDVRQGKRFVLSVDGDVTEEHLAAAREAAERLLSNPVIEDVVSVRAEDVSGDGQTPREHAEEPAEGEDPDAAEADETPREHAEEPAEGEDESDDASDESEASDEADEDEGEQ